MNKSECKSCGRKKPVLAPYDICGLCAAMRAYDRPPGAIPTEGGTKHDAEKPDLSLLPFKALEDVARVMMFGANRYGRDNWKRGFPEHKLISAALRHIGAYNEGQPVDPDSGESHLAHAACNMLFLLWLRKKGTETSDLEVVHEYHAGIDGIFCGATIREGTTWSQDRHLVTCEACKGYGEKK